MLSLALGPLRPTGAQLIQDGAIRPIIALAGRNEAGQHLDDRPMRIHAVDHRLFVEDGQCANFPAWALPVTPKFEQIIDLLDRESKGAGALDEAQLVDVALVENPISVRISSSRTQQACPFVVPDQLCRDARQPCGLTYVHRREPLCVPGLTFQPLEGDRKSVV